MSFSPDGKVLLTVCRKGDVTLWHPETGDRALSLCPGASVSAATFTADGRRVVTAAGQTDRRKYWSEITVWDRDTGQQLYTEILSLGDLYKDRHPLRLHFGTETTALLIASPRRLTVLPASSW